VIQGAKEIRVLLPDDSRVRATEKKYDPNTGFSVIGIELADISDEAMSKIRTAKFGGSTGNSLLGKEVVAAGEPLGISDSLSYGIVTSVSRQIQKTDFNVRLLTTNIYGSSSGRGILVNLKGEIIGLITQDGAASGIKNLVCAYAISDVKGCIERMCNGQDRAYLGIHCTDVTDDISESLGIPEGVYVTKIDEDSPAMECGMQTGDVVTMIGTNEIRKYTDFQSVIDNAHPGDETVITVQRASIGGYSEISFEVKLETFR
jgi:serine protease Do